MMMRRDMGYPTQRRREQTEGAAFALGREMDRWLGLVAQPWRLGAAVEQDIPADESQEDRPLASFCCCSCFGNGTSKNEKME